MKYKKKLNGEFAFVAGTKIWRNRTIGEKE